MKKFATLSLAAAAVLTLSACGSNGAANNTTVIDNEVVLNSEEAPLDNLSSEPTAIDNAVADNGTDASNASLDASNSSVDLNSTTLNTAE